MIHPRWVFGISSINSVTGRASKTYQLCNNTVPNQMSKLENNHPQMAAVCFTQKHRKKNRGKTALHHRSKKRAKHCPTKKNPPSQRRCAHSWKVQRRSISKQNLFPTNYLVQKEINFIHFQFPAVKTFGTRIWFLPGFWWPHPTTVRYTCRVETLGFHHVQTSLQKVGDTRSHPTHVTCLPIGTMYICYTCWNSIKKMDKMVDLIWGKWPSMYCHYIYIYGTCLFLSMGFNPVKEDPFQSKQASLGFQVYLWNLLIGGKCLLFLFSNLLHARRKIHGGNYHFRDAISHCAEYVNTS